MAKNYEVVRELKWESAFKDGCETHKPVPASSGGPYVAYCKDCSAVAYARNTIVFKSKIENLTE